MITTNTSLVGSYIIILIVGIISNSQILMTMLVQGQRRTRTNVYLATMALADLVLLIYCVPIEIAQLYQLGSPEICHRVDFMQQAVAVDSALTLAIIAGCATHCSAESRQRIGTARDVLLQLISSLIMFLFGMYNAMPVLAIGKRLEIIGTMEYDRAFGCIREELKDMEAAYLPGSAHVLTLVTGLLGYTIYNRKTFLSRHLLCRHKDNEKEDGPARATVARCKLDMDEAKMTLLIGLVFGLCWAPLLVGNIMTPIKVIPLEHYGLVNQIFHLLAYAGSAIKPLVYAYMSLNLGQRCKDFLRANLNRWAGDPVGGRPLARSGTETSI